MPFGGLITNSDFQSYQYIVTWTAFAFLRCFKQNSYFHFADSALTAGEVCDHCLICDGKNSSTPPKKRHSIINGGFLSVLFCRRSICPCSFLPPKAQAIFSNFDFSFFIIACSRCGNMVRKYFPPK